ncbi:MAG: Ubiquinone biosynthesis O-methyltransferase [Verrucomicrobia subdivision 3 bacterium]|nr:Ubiquinone biosynthesis O-methyltransferase [Limisphaerales bacterium]MCS1416591.1 Ubiquinone biosynthesis O-methyltransferase [Limisphaerales bacterium]
MNWKLLRAIPFLDTRSRFLASIPESGCILDFGSSDGETLRHFSEMRPDLHYYATDIAGNPDHYPDGCQYHQGDLNADPLPWPDQSLDAITCMHLVEHLNNLTLLLSEAARLLKPSGRIYFETPHPKTLTIPSASGTDAGTFTLNFFDDLTHTKIVSTGALAQLARQNQLQVTQSGTSRNWLFASAYPLYFFLPSSRKKFTAKIHWIGWSAYLIAERPR